MNHLTDDIVTLVLSGMMILLVGLPGILLIVWRVTRPPFQIAVFRWLYLAWGCLLAAGMVWTFTRDPLFSADQAGLNNYIRLGFLALGCLLILAVGARYRFAFILELGTGILGLFFLFSLWCLASTMWSVSPVGTLYKSLEYCAMLALIALTVSLINLNVRDPQDRTLALKKFFDFGWLLVFLLILSVYVGMLLWPEYAILRDYRDAAGVLGFSLQGVMPGISANGVGQLGAILGVVAFIRMFMKPESKIFYASVVAICLLTMVLTQSRSPILAFAVAVVVILLASRRFGILAAFGTLFGGVLITQYSGMLYEFMLRGQNEQNLTSLTGRVTFWQASLDAIQEQLIGGYGANVGGRYVLEAAFGDERSTVHSTWVEVLLDTGLMGLFLLTIAVGMTCFWLFKLRPYAMASPTGRLLWFESLGILTVMLVRSVFAVNLVWSWDVLFFGIVLVYIGIVRGQVVQRAYAGASSPQPLPTAWR